MIGVSLIIAIFLVLNENSLLLECFTVLLFGFFSIAKNRHAEMLDVFQEDILKL